MSAFIELPGFLRNSLPANDDNFSGNVTLPFTLNWFGVDYTEVVCLTNGCVTFGPDSGFHTFSPFGIQKSTVPMCGVYFADYDTRSPSPSLVTYGQDTYHGRAAFGVCWRAIGYYGRNAPHLDKLNAAQLVLVDRSDIAPGDLDIHFCYGCDALPAATHTGTVANGGVGTFTTPATPRVKGIAWETGDASGGYLGLGGDSASVGFSAGTPGVAGSFFTFPGSLVPGSFLDGNLLNGLAHNSSPQTNPLGRYTFEVRNGTPKLPPKLPGGGGGSGGGGGHLTIPSGDLIGTVTPVPGTLGTLIKLRDGRRDTSHSPTGGYSILKETIGDHTVWFQDCGYYPQAKTATVVANKATTLNAALLPLAGADAGKAFLAGYVVDLITQTPLYNATVTTVLPNGSNGPSGVTDINGAFVISGLSAIAYGLTVVAAGYDAYTSPATYTPTIGCTLDAGTLGIPPPSDAASRASLYGYVEDVSTQGPLAGVSVSLIEYPAYLDTSRGDGAYTLNLVPAPKALTLVGTKAGYRARRVPVVTVSGQSQEVDFGLIGTGVPVGVVDGFVTDAATSQPLRNIVVSLPGVTQAITNAQGYYQLADLPVGAAALQAVDPSGTYFAAQANVTVGSGTTVHQNITMRQADGASATLYGRVRDGVSGVGIVGATVGADKAVTTTSGARGAYLLAPIPVPPKTHEADGAAAGYYPVALTDIPLLAGTSTQLDIGLVSLSTPVGKVHGFTFDAQTPAPYTRVYQAKVSLGPYFQTYSTYPDGEYLLPVVPANTVYAVVASADGYEPTRINGLTVGAGKELEMDIPLYGFGGLNNFASLRVTVLKAGSGAVAVGALVDTGISGVPIVTTDAAGTALFPSLPYGPITLAATLTGYRVGVGYATVAAANNLAQILMYGFPDGYTGGQFYGHVTATGIGAGLPINEATVEASPEWDEAYGQGVGATDTGGLYVLDDAPVSGNPYGLFFDHPDYDSASVTGVNAIARTPVKVDVQLSPFDGRIPVGWHLLMRKAFPLSRPVMATVFTIRESGSLTTATRQNYLAMVATEDTAQLARYRKVRIDHRTGTLSSNPLLRYALANAPTVTYHEPGVMAIPVPDAASK